MPSNSSINVLEPPLVTSAKPKAASILFYVTVLLYGVILLYLPTHSPRDLQNSPDEMAVAFFSEGFAQDGHLARGVDRAGLPSLITPRSMLRVNDAFIPVGFVSFPVLFGGFVALLGFKGALAMLAIFSALGLLAWYGFLRSIFGTKLALLSVMLTALHPFILYWAARPLVPNAWFMSFVFFALYFLSRAFKISTGALPQGGVQFETPLAQEPKKGRILYAVLSGITLGLALSLRPQEGIWLVIVPLYILFIPRLRKRISLLVFIVFATLPVFGLLLLQRSLYGSAWRTGYHLTPFDADILSTLKNLIIPFGINFERIGAVIFNYWFALQNWLMALTLLGIIFVVLRQDGRLLKRLRLWAGGGLVIALWLLVFYGSFNVRDRVDMLPSIGTSFTRYFLPFYSILTPLVAYALFRLRARFGKMLTAFIVPLMAVLVLRMVFWGTDESLVKIPKVLAENKILQARLLEVLPENAVVLTDRSDKILFPYRETVGGFRSFSQPDFEELYGYNLYYETIADEEVVKFENENFWQPHGLEAVLPVDLGDRHTLYKLERI
ncbi:glycosyltransferase family 39 protein [Candidatus Uhrbacteria bacterium]|nr:glycosyltransferase family 39 protein [Candidatus Uhrbacteria bacterium]